ncbi:tetratricopeptide repeat protein [Candidatus Omnitrophota bacterium]
MTIPFLCTMIIIPFFLLTTTPTTPTAVVLKADTTASNNPQSLFNNIRNLTQTGVTISQKNYFLTQFNVLHTYTRLLIWPSNQNIDYDYPITNNVFNFSFIISTLFLLTLFIFAWGLKNKFRMISFGIFWFFLTLSIESSIIPSEIVINEHRLYLPMVGFSFAAATILVYIFKKRWLLHIVSSIILICFSFATIQRNAIWKDEISLWKDAHKKSPYKTRPLTNLGIAYKDNKDFDKAIENLSKAIILDPNNATAYTHLAFCYRYKGNVLKEVELLKKAIAINPTYALAYFGLAYHYHREGNLKNAIKYYEIALSLDPNFEAIYKNLAIAYKKNNNPEKINTLINKLTNQGNKHMANLLIDIMSQEDPSI